MKNYVTTYNPFFDRFFLREANESQLMKTDIKERKDHYEMLVDLPGIKKENIELILEDGYLTIKAKYHNVNKDDSYLYQERSYGEYSRSYYVGEAVENKDIHAKLIDGVLSLYIAKVSPKEKETNYIHID